MLALQESWASFEVEQQRQYSAMQSLSEVEDAIAENRRALLLLLIEPSEGPEKQEKVTELVDKQELLLLRRDQISNSALDD